jgi:hypothetical protein
MPVQGFGGPPPFGGGPTSGSFAQYSPWSRVDFRSVIRRELMDLQGRWFTDSEINYYLDMWAQELQQEFEFVWAICTQTVGTVSSMDGTSPPQLVFSTLTLTDPQGRAMLRNEAVYYNNFRLSGRLLQDLEVGNPVWRGQPGVSTLTTTAGYDTPRAAVMYPDSQSILIWPCPPPPVGTFSNVFTFEYPALLSFATDTSVSGMPVWTQWSAKPYVCWKLFQRPSPLNDTKKALRYRAQFQRARLRIRRMWDNFMPERFRRLQPGQHYEWNIQIPPPVWDVGTPSGTGT